MRANMTQAEFLQWNIFLAREAQQRELAQALAR